MTSKRLFPYPGIRTTALVAFLLANAAMAQLAPTAPATETVASSPQTNAPVSTTGTSAKPEEEVVTLSPFEVVADTRGYFSANSMSGTRFNTKVEDLASSLTVMTKEQMEDFAMLDINDVLNFTAGTEGTSTYTDYVIDRNGQLQDNVQLDPGNANRVRGILAANRSYGNFETNRLAMDRLIIDGVEISRGPNANVFGLGYAAGTVNQVPTSAGLSRNKTRWEVRADSYEGYRTSLDHNQVILPNKLAIRVSGAFQHEGFVRKPSGMNTVNYNGFVKYQPFRNTTLSASYLYSRSNGNRPNFTMPRDYVTDWVNAGRPTWDPVLQVIHLNGQTIDRNGVVSGGRAIVPISADSQIPANIPLSRGPNNSRSMLYIDRNGIEYWTVPGTSSVTAAQPTPAANSQVVRLMMSNALGASGGRYANQPLWTTTPTLGDHSFYDWSSINLSAPNRQWDRSRVYTFNVDQVLLNTSRQSLFVQASFFREESMRYQRQPLGNSGISGQTGQFFVDVDERRLDGTPNPFLGRPYIAAGEFTTRYSPAKWDSYRLQAAYKLDLRGERNWLKWLGLHQVTAYDEYKYRINRQWSYRETLTSSHSWTQPGYSGFNPGQVRANSGGVPGGLTAGPHTTRNYFRYYLGDAIGSNIEYAPGEFQHGSYPFVWGGYRTITNSVVDQSTGVFQYEPATLELMPTTDQTGAGNNLKQIIKTPGGVIQSHFLNGAIVTTFGMRQDQVYSKNGINAVTPETPIGGPNLTTDHRDHDWDWNNSWQYGDYRYNIGKTKTAGVVARPFRDLRFVNNAANGTGPLSWLADAARGLSLTYNTSDNFYPQAPAIDVFRNQLPNVTGRGKDYGFWLNMADGKVVIRFNRYTTKQLNIRNGDANTIAQRALRIDLDVSSDHFQLYDRATDWWRLTHPEWNETQVRAAVLDQMQFGEQEYNELQSAWRTGTIAATNDFTASGTEVEINVNPTRHWRISGSVTEQKAVSSNISSVVQQWIDRRMPVWESIVDQNYDPALGTGPSAGWAATPDNPQHLWWIHGYNRTSFPNGYYANNVAAPYKVIKQQEGKSRPSVRKYNVKFASSLDLAALTEQRYIKNVRLGLSGNWQDKGAIGYYGVEQFPAIVTELDPNRPIWDKARLYVGGFVSYRTKLFRNKVSANFQLNVENIGENGRLQAIGAFPDGTPNAYRIVDPQKFIFSASFNL